nr:probable protein S-acyltransferase 12 [Ipomoea batatas]
MDMNPFRLCSGLRFLGYFMIVIVLAIVAVSYYAVVIVTWGPHLLDGGSNSFFSFTILSIFHILLVLLSWSYIRVILQDPGSVPENWKVVPEQSVEEGCSVSLPANAGPENVVSASSSSGTGERRQAVGFCSHCQNGKPPRCHHCSVCQRCVLKMDHHCLWVVNCIGARNYKFFLLFVIYTFLETTLDTLVLLPSFIEFFKKSKHHSLSPGNLAIIFLSFVLNLAFALSLLCFVVMHASLVSSNTTSVEVYEKKRNVRWKYDLGWKQNFVQVFGSSKALWFLPLFSKKDLESIPALHGLEFPARSDENLRSS